MPAAAVTPAPEAYTKIVAVKTLVVHSELRSTALRDGVLEVSLDSMLFKSADQRCS